MFRVEYAGTSINQKLTHAWNCSNIKVTTIASFFQFKGRVETQNVGTKVIRKIKEKRIWPMQDMYNQ